MLRYFLGLNFYSNTIFGNIIGGKKEVTSLYYIARSKPMALTRQIFSHLIFICAHAGYLVTFTETGK